MKVLLVHPRTGLYGGAELVIVRLANYLSEKGHDVNYLTTGLPRDMWTQIRQQVKIINLDKTDKLSDMVALLTYLNKHSQYYDIINYHNFPATLCHHANGAPTVWYCNEPPELFSTWWRKLLEDYNRWLVKYQIKNVVVADDFNKYRFQNIYRITPRVIPYGIDYEFFNYGEDIPHKRYTVLQVGTVSYYKNQIASVKAIEQVKKDIPDIQLIIIGKVCDKYGESVIQYVKDNNLSDNVMFAGHLPRTAVRDWYKSSDLVLHPVKAQGGWLTPFEALAAGRPVIVSKDITCADMIKVKNVAPVTDNFVWEIMHHWLNKLNKSDEGQQSFVKNFLSWDRFGFEMEKYFMEVINK